ncbi:CD276 antigen homolog [Brachyhypopomus gauderio]|uniref:CD276 antigen homolog n=1 Tax=Brachyhypopomus gauderio TaxID=698409 RepID=UPI0040433736
MDFGIKQGCWFICVFILLIDKVLPKRIIQSTISDSVILHCASSEATMRRSSLNVFWRYGDSKTLIDIIHGRASLVEQETAFRGRVDSFPGEYRNGNFSIRLRDVKLSDAGTYTCFIPHAGMEMKLDLMVKDRISPNTSELKSMGVKRRPENLWLFSASLFTFALFHLH